MRNADCVFAKELLRILFDQREEPHTFCSYSHSVSAKARLGFFFGQRKTTLSKGKRLKFACIEQWSRQLAILIVS